MVELASVLGLVVVDTPFAEVVVLAAVLGLAVVLGLVVVDVPLLAAFVTGFVVSELAVVTGFGADLLVVAFSSAAMQPEKGGFGWYIFY